MGRYLYLICWVVLVVLSIVPFHLNPDNFLADDAYFYLQIAKNIAAGHGSTFHGVTETNGYHPLWMGFCVVGAWLIPNDPKLLLHVMGAVQT